MPIQGGGLGRECPKRWASLTGAQDMVGATVVWPRLSEADKTLVARAIPGSFFAAMVLEKTY